jgi:hypothetical protein
MLTRHSPLLLLIVCPKLLKPNTNIKDFFLFEDLLNGQIIFSYGTGTGLQPSFSDESI